MVYISENAPAEVAEYVRARGYGVTIVGGADGVSSDVASHPDLSFCRVGNELFKAGEGELGRDYPENAAFCAAVLDDFFIHNLKITAPRLLAAAARAGLKPVHVRQGYAKCSCVAVDGRSVITADAGVIRALRALKGVDVLEITPGFVALPGREYGFLGGASGRVGDELIFCGDITAHPDFERIYNFVKERGVRPKWFDFPLTDVGTILEA